MTNEKQTELIKAVGELGFTVVEIKQERLDGYTGPVEVVRRNANGTIMVRLLPTEED